MNANPAIHTGLACAGGVVEGAIYELGSLCALETAVEGLDFTRMDVYVGVSSGALITACLANGIPVRALERAVVEENAPDAELNFMPEILFVPAVREYARRLRSLPHSVLTSLGRILSNPRDASFFGVLAGLGPLIPVGLFDNTPLRDYLRTAFHAPGRTDDFRGLAGRLRIVGVELDTAEIAVFGRAPLEAVPISSAVQASTALPGLYCPVEIDGVHYIDGVARRTVHASVALEEGARLLFCVNPIVPVRLDPRADEHEEGLMAHGLPAVLSQTFRTLVYSRMRTGIRNYIHTYPDTDLLLVEPTFEDHHLFFSNIFSFSNRAFVFRHAYERTMAYLTEHAEEVGGMLDRYGYALRTEVPAQCMERQAEEAPRVLADADRALDRLDALLRKIDPSL